MRSQAAIVLALGLVSDVAAFWRMPCRSQTGRGRLDPIEDYGQISGHVHTIHGSGGFGFEASYESLTASNCTSCEVTQDKSAYWTPAVYFLYDNGTSVMVNQVGGMLAYYLYYLTNVTAFPEGFQMIAGNPNVRSFEGSFPDTPLSSWPTYPSDQFFLQQRALGFNCLNYNKAAEASLYRHQFPSKEYMDAQCTDGLRLELAFPSCGNGSLDSSDHRSHVKYPSLVKEGNCPDGYDEHYPFLFFETIWDTYAFAGESGQFALSFGDPVGTGYHGDFMMGWESQEFLQEALDTCQNESGEISDCALFDIQSDAEAAECLFEMPEVLKDDDVMGPRNGLPVNVPMQYGPGTATAYAVAGVSGVSTTSQAPETTPSTAYSAPTLSYTAADPSVTATAQGGIVVNVAESGGRGPIAPIKKSSASSSSLITSSSSAASSTQANIIATSYMTTGNEVVAMAIEQVDVTVTVSATTTPNAGHKHKRHFEKHAHHHHF